MKFLIMRKLISIVTPCYNEGENVVELCERVSRTMSVLPYDYEHVLIDNCSSDDTVDKLRRIASADKRVKVIINARNFGHIRSPYYGLLQTRGAAAILIASDLQDPPEMLPEFISKWESGFKIVLAVKPESDESRFMFFVRKLYYYFIGRVSDVPLVKNATGAGLFDRDIIEILKKINDPYPYFRGLLCEIGFPIAKVYFRQPRRKRGVTSNNFYTLFDLAMLGVTNHTKIPLRVMTMAGFLLSFLSLLVAFGFLIAKFIFWDSFDVGVAPIVIGIFFFAAVQIFFMGLLGEYIGSIHTKIRNMPLVIESERINFP
jgi:glycosyltransferase involved in cell wall biosynthesis